MATPASNKYRRFWASLAASPLILGGTIFLLALPPRLIGLDVFVGPDEYSWVTRSASFAQALATGNLAETYQTEHPAVPLMWLGAAEIWLQAGGEPPNWAQAAEKTVANLASKRQGVAVVNAALLGVLMLLLRPVFGSGVAWLTGVMLAFDPFLLTEARALRSEGIVTSLSAAALAGLLLYQVKPRQLTGLLAGALTGLALLSKISVIALLPVGMLALGLPHWLNRQLPLKKRWIQAGLALFGWGSAILVTIILAWPAVWAAPNLVWQRLFGYMFVRGVEGGGGSAEIFLLGQAYPDNVDPGWLFYPVVWLFRTSPMMWVGLILLAVAVWPLRRLPRRQLLLVALIALYLLLYFAVITRTALKYDRYIIPMIPPFTILAALGLTAAWQTLAGRWPTAHGWGWLAVGGVLATQMALALPNSPYYYTYFNPLLGGIRQARQSIPIGTGSEGIDQIAAYLNQLPNADTLTLASGNSQKIRPLLKGQTIAMSNLDGLWVQGDTVMIYISQVQLEKHADDILAYLERSVPLKTVTLQGVEYAWLYPGPSADYYGGGHKLEGRGALFGYNLCAGPPPCPPNGPPVTSLAAGDTLSTRLIWRNEGQLPDDLFFVRLMDLDGYIWAEGIAQPRPGFEAAARQENSIVESEASLQLPVGMPPGNYFIKPGFRRPAGEVIGYFELPAATHPISVTTAANYPAAIEPPLPAALAAPDLKLLGYGLPPTPPAPGQPFWLTLFWQATANIQRDYVILLRLLAADGSEAAYWLGRPVRSGYPTAGWQAGQIVQDPWRLELAPDTPPGEYRLEIALFDAATEAEMGRTALGGVSIQAAAEN